MRKDIDRDLEKRLSELRGKFPEYSPQNEFILRIGWNIRSACNSLIPNSYLWLAQDKVEMYEEKNSADVETINGLWEVTNGAWDLYGEKEAVST